MSIEKDVELRGTAIDAKAGAVIKTDDGSVVYIKGLPSWPDDVIGKKVVATGTLHEEKFIPDPRVDADGAVSAGAHGTQAVLGNPKWRFAE